MPSIFIRTSGCNLRCVWCDTPYTSWEPEGKDWSMEKILRQVGRYPSRHVVITGGEPFLAPEIEELTDKLKSNGLHITIETAATVFKPVACDLASLSPKLSNSTPWQREGGRFALRHEQLRLQPDVIRAFMERYPYQLKFVIDRPSDIDEVLSLLSQLPEVDRSRVL